MRAHLGKSAFVLVVSAAISWLGSGAAAHADDRPADERASTENTPSSEQTQSRHSYYAVQGYQLDLSAIQSTRKGVLAQYGQVEERRWPNRGLMTTSAFVFTAAYLPAIIAAAVNDDDTSDNLFIPIAGPWMEIARDPVSPGNKALLALSGVFQDLGALGLVTSMLVPERTTKRWRLLSSRRVSAAPMASRYGYGLSAHGRF